MIDSTIDAVDAFATRYRWPISILGVVWLGLSFASWAGLITLPELAILNGKPAVYASSAFNAFWWAWMNPRIQKRRAERVETSVGKAEIGNG